MQKETSRIPQLRNIELFIERKLIMKKSIKLMGVMACMSLMAAGALSLALSGRETKAAQAAYSTDGLTQVTAANSSSLVGRTAYVIGSNTTYALTASGSFGKSGDLLELTIAAGTDGASIVLQRNDNGKYLNNPCNGSWSDSTVTRYINSSNNGLSPDSNSSNYWWAVRLEGVTYYETHYEGAMGSEQSKFYVYAAPAPASYSGSIAVECQYIAGDGADHYWDVGNAKIAAHIYNTEDVGAMCDFWTDLVTMSATSETHKYLLPFSNTIDPFAGEHTVMDVYRFNPVVEDAADGMSEGQYWNSATNVSMGTILYVHGWNSSISSAKHWIGAASNSWTFNHDYVLRNASLSGSNFQFSADIDLTDSDQFKVYVNSDAYAGKFSCDPTLSGIITGDQTNNIQCSTADTYRMYYNAGSYSVHVTTPKYVIADEFAQFFLANVGCDATGVAEPTGWATVAAAYPTDGDARDFICSADPVKEGTYLQQCVYWYKVAITQHPGLTKFMVNSSGVARTFSGANAITLFNNNNSMIIVIVVSSLALVSFAGLLALKRKEK